MPLKTYNFNSNHTCRFPLISYIYKFLIHYQINLENLFNIQEIYTQFLMLHFISFIIPQYIKTTHLSWVVIPRK